MAVGSAWMMVCQVGGGPVDVSIQVVGGLREGRGAGGGGGEGEGVGGEGGVCGWLEGCWARA